MTLPAPKAILFDWDNTLVNTWPTIHAALNHCLREMGHDEWPLERVKSNVKKSMRDAFPEMFGDKWEDAAHIYQAHYRSIHLDDLQPLEGAVELLDFLKKQPIYVALVSNKRGPTLRLEAENLGWSHYFDRLIGATDADRDKPDPAPALLALNGSGIAPARDVWFIGDTVIDLECANNLGATAVLYGDVKTNNDKYLGHAFEVHAKNHAQLLSILSKHET
jgi:phosphoglycolate phosphatase